MTGTPRYPAEVREAALVLHRAGKTTREIGDVIPADASTIARWVREAGEQRQRGNRKREDISDTRIRELHFTHGWSPAQIAGATGMSRGGVRKRIARITAEGYAASPCSMGGPGICPACDCILAKIGTGANDLAPETGRTP